ncbi:hypothetical protein Patl1_31193 [Pistacia atlantica]|uniref:Uncharacterized protein n=1 Tax=Pistacia atlantica TaxID=434234 RepID=A0ACC1AA99_9ROSI|nr:hypothetical protein Patl1_31193 [Pistacia atlantica]
MWAARRCFLSSINNKTVEALRLLVASFVSESALTNVLHRESQS